ncbi:spastin [Histoplasma capsulatum H143]|uniref:Spastin n=1 Tax=Ajellomyces capsulatus (strain H143) TaxID=544712 RepID=C6HJQ5_AJECH|nr:spastin [Histoplasma capsulatum H143]
MHSSLPYRLLSVHQYLRTPYRIIGCRSLPNIARSFHTSSPSASNSNEPPSINPTLSNNTDNAHNDSEGQDSPKDNAETEKPEVPPAPSKKPRSPYGSAVRRAIRNRKPRERTHSVAVVPEWFHERNVIAQDTAVQIAIPTGHDVELEPLSHDLEEGVNKVAQGGDGGESGGSGGPPTSSPRYRLAQAVWDELCASARAGLNLPVSRYIDERSATKSHLVLQYPGEGGILFLDAVVKKLAANLKTHLVTLNAQDIAELYAEQDQAEPGTPSSIATMGYEVYQPKRTSNPKELEEDMEEGEEDENEEEDPDMIPSRRQEREFSVTRTIPLTGIRDTDFIQSLLGGRASVGMAKVIIPRSQRQDLESREELRCLRIANELLSIPHKQEHKQPHTPGDQKPSESVLEPAPKSISDQSQLTTLRPDLIVQVQDYNDIQNTRSGSIFLTLLHRAVQSKRREGQRVIIIGTVSGKKPEYPLGKAYPKLVQRDFNDQFARTIVVTPAMNPQVVEKVFSEDLKRRTFEINVRHLQNMLRVRLNDPHLADASLLRGPAWPVDTGALENAGLDDGYWSFDRVHRVVSLALGGVKGPGKLDLQHIQRSIDLVEKSDRAKGDWLAERHPKVKPPQTESERESRLKQLRKTCNTHERKLLNGVVDAESIRTTFDDVHAPPDTIEALKTLTSLSLIRPDAFTYGVLSTDKIPGLLLYGPPGTGKTMLAKAVARQSGATVLEVSGSEVYDMYVGEGEKNVKAIFTLAKKLSPCVVFIDEADAIFGSRVAASTRTTHRELINQFLREWDGMNELSAFIMVATNRPFDLDDAVLRRLPRRLLVDLPTEQDRLAILKIHLKEEQVDSSVDLVELASRTPLYSGSDLKNMCVAAALACVRGENELAAQHTGEEPYRYPERRTLTKAHFERALEEISASISEDMSSLSAIKKFDEKYGDRKGRRKKSSGWGFAAPSEAQKNTETGRVRN